MPVRQTSIKSYIELPQLSRWQEIVYKCFQQTKKPTTDSEIINWFNIPEKIQPRARRHELWKQGLLHTPGKRKCTITHRLALTWEPTN